MQKKRKKKNSKIKINFFALPLSFSHQISKKQQNNGFHYGVTLENSYQICEDICIYIYI